MNARVSPAHRVIIYSKVWIVASSYSYFVEIVKIKDKNLLLFFSIIALNLAELKRLNHNIILNRLLNLKQLIMLTINKVRILISLLAKLTMKSLPREGSYKLRCTFMFIPRKPFLYAWDMNELHWAGAFAWGYQRILD